MKKLRAIITVGISNSGKSSWAEEKCRKDRTWWNVNRDDLRFMLTGAKNWGQHKFNKTIEKSVIKEVQAAIFKEAYANQKNIIVSDTGLNNTHRNNLIEVLENIGFATEVKEFPISYEEALKRDRSNPKGVGQDVIYRQYSQWLDYKGRKRYQPDTTKPSAVIFDVDGTLADMEGIRGAFEWDKVKHDLVRPFIRDMFRDLEFARNYEMIVLSGRDGVCEEDTREWLYSHQIRYDQFYMRKEGDSRKDADIKEEIFWDHIADNYNVVAVVDDRPQMVRRWYELGIPNVISVGNPYIEF